MILNTPQFSIQARNRPGKLIGRADSSGGACRVPCHPDYAPRPAGWEEDDRRGVGSEDEAGWAVAVPP